MLKTFGFTSSQLPCVSKTKAVVSHVSRAVCPLQQGAGNRFTTYEHVGLSTDSHATPGWCLELGMKDFTHKLINVCHEVTEPVGYPIKPHGCCTLAAAKTFALVME